MKSIKLSSLRLPASARWRAHARRLVHAARSSADASHAPERTAYSFEDSQHPLWAIANGIAIFFLVMCAVSFFVLMADAFLTRA
jgi:hypothetical protein